MFVRCETWLEDMQEVIWQDREWGRTANYTIPGGATGEVEQDNGTGEGQENELLVALPPPAPPAAALPQQQQGQQLASDVAMTNGGVGEFDDMEMHDDNGELEQFQWP